MKFRSALWIALFASTLTASVANAEDVETKRDVVVASHDLDGNKRLEKKELKAMKKEHPAMYENLIGWCPDAKEHPKMNGVEMPENPTDDNQDCGKKAVSRIYLNAWTLGGKPVEVAPVEAIPVPVVEDGSPR